MIGLFISAVVVSSVVQLALVCGYVARLWRFKQPLVTDAECSKAAVVLCLRGGDPFLSQCLAGLLNQDYPTYRVVVVVDHETDPANLWVDAALQKPHRCEVERLVLDSSNDRCSLKCAALVQAVRGLDPQVRIVAQLDADAVPHPTWLREICTALRPPDVGAVTGNRWYLPDSPNLATMIRLQWNCGAVVLMYWLQIAWGGTLGMKREAIDRAGLLGRWENAFCEDTMSFRALKSAGYRLDFVPSLMMINREECRMGPFFSWLMRQLLTVRLYHSAWPVVAFHGVSAAILLVIGTVWSLALIGQGHSQHAAMIGATLVAAQLGLVSSVIFVDRAVRRIACQRNDNVDRPRLATIIVWSWAIVITQLVYVAALLRCVTLQNVSWRGVRYQIDSAWEIYRGPYQPYEVATSLSAQESL